jgi:hypothetical protein
MRENGITMGNREERDDGSVLECSQVSQMRENDITMGNREERDDD